MNKYDSNVYENYNLKTKFLGIISYKNLIIVGIYFFVIFKILTYINLDIVYKSYIVMALVIPVLASYVVNVNGDNIIDTIKILIKFYSNRKIYVNDYKNVMMKTKYIKSNNR